MSFLAAQKTLRVFTGRIIASSSFLLENHASLAAPPKLAASAPPRFIVIPTGEIEKNYILNRS
jgi:hypothetical protein